MAVRRWKYAVSLERPETGAPITIRGDIAAGSAKAAASRAVREALQTIPGARYASLSILLERIGVD